MAERRVPVERLRPSARLQAVARPVETYVRPAETPVQESELGAFVRAVAPAAQTLAELQKQEALKKNREIERGNASRRAFDAKLGAGRALREAYQDFADNESQYLNLSSEEIAARRQDIMQPYFDKVAASGDDILVEAFAQDIQLGNLNWFTQNYDPAKARYDLDNQLNDVFTEIIAIQDNPDNNAPAFDDPFADQSKPVPSIADQHIGLMLKEFQKVNNIPWPVINEYALKLVTNQAVTQGRTALYKYLESEGQLNVARFQDTVKTLNANLARYDAAVIDGNKDNVFMSTVLNEVSSYAEATAQGIPVAQTFNDSVTFADGSSRSVSDEDRIVAFEMYANQQGLNMEQRVEQFYRPLGIVPTEISNYIVSGKFMLTSGDINDAGVNLALKAYEGYKFIQGYGIQPTEALMGTEDKRLFHALDYLIEKAGVGGVDATPAQRMSEALRMVQDIDLDAPRKRVSIEETIDALDPSIFVGTDLEEVTNINDIAQYLNEGMNVYMQISGTTKQAALQRAVKDARMDFFVLEASNGAKTAFNLLNTNIQRRGNEVAQLQSYLNEYIQSETAMQRLAESSGGTGYTLLPTRNPNQIKVAIVDDLGNLVGGFMEVPLSVASDPATVTNMMRVRMNQAQEDAQFVTGSLGTIIEPIEEVVTETTVAEGLPTIEEDVQVTALPIATDINPNINIITAREIHRDGVFTGFYLYEGTLNGSSTMVKSSKKPEDVLPPEAIQTVPEPEPYMDAIMRIAQNVESVDDLEALVEEDQEQARQIVSEFAQAFEETQEFSQNQIDELKKKALRSKAIKDMEGTDSAKESILDKIIGLITGDYSAQASESDRVGNIEGTTMTNKATNLIMSQEGFEKKPYPDGKDRSVGYGFYLPSLSDDERALIKDVENITKEEADAVLAVKVQKIEQFAASEMPQLNTLSEEAQAAVVSMMYQLGAENVKKKFPTFFRNLKLATESPVGSPERQEYLNIAAGNMIYNFDSEGKRTSKTLWHRQTPKRAKAMAALVEKG